MGEARSQYITVYDINQRIIAALFLGSLFLAKSFAADRLHKACLGHYRTAFCSGPTGTRVGR